MKYKKSNRAGSEGQYDPRPIEEIVQDFLAHSNSPFAVAYRQQQAQQKARRQHTAGTKGSGWQVNTELDVNVKTLLRQDKALKPEKEYLGLLRKDVECDEFFYDEHLTFIEVERQKGEKRNPRVYNGRYITVTRRSDGTLRPNFKPLPHDADFSAEEYAVAVARELLQALQGLVEENYTKGTVPNV